MQQPKSVQLVKTEKIPTKNSRKKGICYVCKERKMLRAVPKEFGNPKAGGFWVCIKCFPEDVKYEEKEKATC